MLYDKRTIAAGSTERLLKQKLGVGLHKDSWWYLVVDAPDAPLVVSATTSGTDGPPVEDLVFDVPKGGAEALLVGSLAWVDVENLDATDRQVILRAFPLPGPVATRNIRRYFYPIDVSFTGVAVPRDFPAWTRAVRIAPEMNTDWGNIRIIGKDVGGTTMFDVVGADQPPNGLPTAGLASIETLTTAGGVYLYYELVR